MDFELHFDPGMNQHLPLVAAVFFIGCSVAGTTRNSTLSSAKVESHVRDANPQDLGRSQPSLELGNLRLLPSVCAGMNLSPEYRRLTADDFIHQLNVAGFSYHIERAREDLIYVDVSYGSTTSRFRVATLASATDAARHLHEAILEHGQGSWGVHRSNIAILGPIDNLPGIVDFAVSSKLACWGVLTVAGRDDCFAVPGGYQEL
jgi:hypothetical protein